VSHETIYTWKEDRYIAVDSGKPILYHKAEQENVPCS